MNLTQKVALNTGVQIGGRVVALAVGLLTLRLTAGYLGVSSFGQLAIVISVTGLVAVIADLGVTTTLARELAKAPGDATRLGGDLLRFRLTSSFSAAALVLVLIPFLPYDYETKLALAIAVGGMVFTILGGFPIAFFQTNLRQDLSAAVDILTKSLGLGAIVLVRALDLGLYGLVALMVGVNAVGCLAAFSLSRRFWSINLRTNWARARPLVRDSILIGIVSMIGLLHFRGDAILLSFMKPAADVGIYAIAFRFVDQAFLLAGLFLTTMFPIITRAIHHDPERAQYAINRTFQALALAGIAVTLTVYVLASPLVRLVAGPEFDAAVEPLRVLALALPSMFVAPVFYNVLISLNKQKTLIVFGLASLAFNVSLNLVLIPRYSYNGAAAATVVSETLVLAGLLLIARRHYEFQLDKAFLPRMLGATAVAIGVLVLVPSDSPWLGVALVLLAFCAAAYVLKAVSRSDVEAVFQRSGT